MQGFDQILDTILGYLPNLLAALGILVFGALVAFTIAALARAALRRTSVDNKMAEWLAGEQQKPIEVEAVVGRVVFWLLMIFVLVAFFEALNLTVITQPLNELLNEVLVFLPRLLGAAALLVIAWMVATALRTILTQLLNRVRLDERLQQEGLEGERKATLAKALADVVYLSTMVGLIVYILVLIPVIIAALNALAIDAITQPASNMLDTVLSVLPSIVAALLLLTVAYIVGRLIAGFATALLSGMGFDGLIARLGLGQPPTEGQYTPSAVAGYIVLVAVMLFAAIEALALLGFETLSGLVSDFTVFGGDILLGAVVFGLGMFFANVAARAIRSSGAKQAPTLSLAARVAILVLAGAMALQQVAIADEIIILTFGLCLGAVAVAVAVAFGLGGRDLAAHKLEEWRHGGNRD